ncbi:MAG: bifunctional lysylphosphatidylglycerol flippase/synthetase MprF [Geminicoccaceae bacterium]
MATEVGAAAAPEQRLRRWLPPLLGLVLFAVALWAIHRELAEHPLAAIESAVDAIPWRDLVLALLLTAGSYLCLSLYDSLALRWLGRKVPPREALAAGFVSFALTQNLGLAPLTGGAARYRLYGSFGLSALDIAALLSFNALTLALGMAGTAGLAAVLAPDALATLLRLPAGLVAMLGWVALLAVAAVIVAGAFLRREIAFRELRLKLPPPPLAVAQLGIGLVDWTMAGLALWILLPADAGVGPLAFLGVFVLAGLVATISHVPAGLGVFEAVIFLALPDQPAQPGVAAALVVYRIVYYVLPLLVAGGLLGAGQLRRLQGGARAAAGRMAPLAALVLPNALALMVAVSGIVLLVSGVTPAEQDRIAALGAWVPPGLVNAAHFLASLCGLVLLLLAPGLRGRLDGAWVAAALALPAGAVLSLLKGLDWEEALLAVLTLVLLLPSRRLFHRRSALTAQPLSPGWLVGILAVLLSVTWLGFFAYRHVEYGPQLWWEFLLRADAPRFLRATAGCFLLLLVVGVVQVVRYARPRDVALPSAADLERAEAAIRAAEAPPSNAWVALLGDKRLLFSDSGRSFIMFGVQGRSWIAIGEPVGLRAERAELLWRFRELADGWGARCAFYESPPSAMPELVELGLSFQKLGEQAFVPLADFSLEGSKRSGLRQAVNRCRRDGAEFAIVPVEEVPAILDRLETISTEWLGGKSVAEKGFSVGRFDRAYLARQAMAVVRRDGEIHAFANLWTTADKGELSIDLMRYGKDAPRDVMDLLFAELMLWGRAQGYRRFDLGMAPLSGLEAHQLAPLLDRAGALVFRHGEHFYNFEGLRRYKEKFRPEWEPRYLAAPGGLTMARVLADATLLVGGGLRGVLGR